MAEYFIVFLFLFLFSLIFYVLYERYFKQQTKSESELYNEALRALLDGKEETAFTKLRQVVTEDSSNIDAYLRLGAILRNNNKPQQALQVHKDLTLRGRLEPNVKVNILRQLYFDYIDLNNFEMAKAALQEMTTINSKNRWSFVRLLELQKEMQLWDEAYDTAVMLLKLEENKSKQPLASFKYHMGDELYKKREYHKARILFKEALGFDPEYVDAYLSIGDSYLDEDRIEDAVNFWIKLIKTVPDKGHLVIERLKKALFELGRYGEIDQICENILKHSPKNYEAKLCLAEFHEKKGDTDQAEEILIEVVEENPENIKSVLELIRIYLDKNDNKKIEDLIKSIEQRRIKRNNKTAASISQ
jgi:lipopolysaccharide biosynthesis regulator YciM